MSHTNLMRRAEDRTAAREAALEEHLATIDELFAKNDMRGFHRGSFIFAFIVGWNTNQAHHDGEEGNP